MPTVKLIWNKAGTGYGRARLLFVFNRANGEIRQASVCRDTLLMSNVEEDTGK